MRGSDFLQRKLTIAPISLVAISCFDGLSESHDGRNPESLGKVMRRRDFIKVIAGATVAWPLPVSAQERVRRIGVLMNGSARDAEQQGLVTTLAQTLQQLGWTEGRNLHIDIRWGEGDPQAIRRHAESLVAGAPDVIVS